SVAAAGCRRMAGSAGAERGTSAGAESDMGVTEYLRRTLTRRFAMTRAIIVLMLLAVTPSAFAASGLCAELELAERALGLDAGYEIAMHPRHMAQIESTLGPEISGVSEQA